ncbi:hypothetical protein ACLB2K_035566 [Fragaria x ananassa]
MKANTTHQAHLPSTGHRRLATKALMGIRTPDLLVREIGSGFCSVWTLIGFFCVIDYQAHLAPNIYPKLWITQ